MGRSHELHRWHLCTSVLGTLLSQLAKSYATLLLLAMDAVVSACVLVSGHGNRKGTASPRT